MRRFLLSPLTAATILATASAAAAPYLTSLGVKSEPRGVSPDGSAICGKLGSNGFVRSPNGSTLLTGQFALAEALATTNGGSVVVGFSSGGANMGGTRWQNGIRTDFVALPGIPAPFASPSSQAVDISANGLVIVGHSTSSERFQEAYRWENGVAKPLGVLPGASGNSRAMAISADGMTIVGQSATVDGQEAFVRRGGEEGIMVGLGDAPDGPVNSMATAVSADGSVIVGAGTELLNEQPRLICLRWTTETGLQRMIAPGGLLNGQAHGVSGDGAIIVGEAGDALLNRSAVLWEPTIGSTLLSNFLEASGVDTTGWILASIRGISQDGDTIVGEGLKGGIQEGWMVTGVQSLLYPGAEVPLPVVKLSQQGTTMTIRFSTRPGYTYQVQRSTTLAPSDWTPVGGLISTVGASGAVARSLNNTIPAGTGRIFYRVQVLQPGA